MTPYVPIVPLLFYSPYHRNLLQQAKALLDEGRYPLSVVLAQTACEVFTEQMMVLLTDILDVPLREWIWGRLPRTADLDNEPIRELYTALSGDEIQKQPFWSAYKDHVRRRHQVVHRGVDVDRVGAEHSYNAALRLIEHVESVRKGLLDHYGVSE